MDSDLGPAAPEDLAGPAWAGPAWVALAWAVAPGREGPDGLEACALGGPLPRRREGAAVAAVAAASHRFCSLRVC